MNEEKYQVQIPANVKVRTELINGIGIKELVITGIVGMICLIIDVPIYLISQNYLVCLIFFGIITGFTFVCEVGAYILGIPVLSWLYGVNLKKYKVTLLLLLLCGGINAINIIFYYVLAIMRKQKYMTILYIIVCLVSFLIMDTMTVKMGLTGASLGYLILVSLLAALLLVYIIIQTRRNTKNE